MRLATTTAVSLAVIALGCATNPERIRAQPVDESVYDGWDCDRLSEASGLAVTELAAMSEKQAKTASSDAWGVFWIGLPVGSMGGNDIEPDIARVKGELKAIRKLGHERRCVFETS